MKSFNHILIALIFSPVALFAQNSRDSVRSKNLGDEVIDIVKAYQPVLNDAFKININPQGDTSSQKSPVLNYTVDPRPINSNYNLTPIKPVRIKDDNIKKLYHGYVKAGYGLENMPMIDFNYNTLRSKNLDGGIHFKHLSSAGKLKGFGYPGQSTNELGLYGTKYFPTFALGANLDFDRRVVHYYGFNSPPDLYTKSETKHRMNEIGGKINLSSLDLDKDKLRYNAALDLYSWKDNKNKSENNVGLNFGGGKNFEGGYAGAKASLEFMNVDQDSFSYNRTLIRIRPSYQLIQDLITLDAAVNITFEGNDGESKAHIHPDVKASYQVIDDQFSIFAGVHGDIIRNDVRSLSKENPFTGTVIPTVNSNNKLTVFGGTKVKLEHNLMFIAEASYGRIKDQPFFYNIIQPDFPLTYSVLYEDVNLFHLKGSLEYKKSEKITLGLTADINKYKTDTLSHALYTPFVKFGVNAEYNIAEKIYVKADFFYNGEAYALDSDLEYMKIKGYLDANIGVDYRYTKNLSLFAQLNNLGFSRYYKYYNYPSYRFNGMIGVTYSF